MSKNYYDTPWGEAVGYTWVSKPDTKFNADGVYKISVALSGAEAQAMKEKVDLQAQGAFENHLKDKGISAKDAKKWSLYVPYEVDEDDAGNPTGFIVFDFKQNARIKLRDGSVKDIAIGVRGPKNEEVKKPLYAGSEVRVRYAFRPIVIASAQKAGVRLDFSMVQVRKLSSGNGAKGFGAVEGYTLDQDDGQHEDEVNEAGPVKATAGADF